jgi:tetratricopeptide (TPR) repeat protein
MLSSKKKDRAMKTTFVVNIVGALLVTVLFQGFQCASSEFTGAKMHIQQREYDKALKLLEAEVSKNPQNEEAWYLLGAVRAEKNDYEGMNAAFTQALKLSNLHAKEIRDIRYSRWGTHINNGVNYLERASSDSAQYYEMSINEFKKSIAAWPDTGLTYRYLAYAYNNKGDLENALAAYKKAWAMGDEAESAKRAGLIHIRRGQEKKNQFESKNAEALKAMKNLDRVRRNTPKSDVMLMLGAPDEVKRGPRGTKKEDWTYKKYNLTVSLDADKVVSKKFSVPYDPQIDSTDFHVAMKEFTQAIEILEQARNKDPKDAEIVNFLMQAYIEADRINEAISTFQVQVQADPANKQNRYILGVLFRSAGKFDEAIAEFQEALKIDPNFADAIYDIGATYYNWGVDIIRDAEEKGIETKAFIEKFEKALPYMEKVSEQKKDDPQIWDTLGTIYARLGKTDKATKAFEMSDKLRQGK